MAISLSDLRLHYGEAGAREKFERMCSLLIRSEYPDAQAIRVHVGDGGVDTSVGDWNGTDPVTVYQQKYFPDGLGESQKEQIRNAYNTARKNPRFVLDRWVLCLPIDLSSDEQKWWSRWKNKKDRTIELWGALKIEALLYEPKNRGILEEFFRLYDQRQIREIHEFITGQQGLVQAARTEAQDEQARMGWLQALRRASLARSMERWLAAGVRRKDAQIFFEDHSVGQPPTHIRPSAEKPLVLLVGELGSGKSLYGERIHLGAIDLAEADAMAPLPVYLRARDMVAGLEQEILAAVRGLGDAGTQGVALVLDGVDEAPLSVASSCLSQARVLVEEWPNTTVLVTARPVAEYGRAQEAVRVPLLSDAESYALMSRIAGESEQALGAVHQLSFRIAESKSLRDAISRPLFAILAGGYLRLMPEGKHLTKVELIEYLVQRSVRRVGEESERALHLLERLAVLSTDRGGKPVVKHEVASGADLRALLETRLAVEHAGSLSFPLPLLAEWFAARSLTAGFPTSVDLLSDPVRLERWFLPMVTHLATSSLDQASRLLEPLVRANPGMASSIMKEGLASWGAALDLSLPSPLDCGAQVHRAMAAWVDAVGPLAQLIAPVDGRGRLLKLGVSTFADGTLITAWLEAEDTSPDIFEMPQQLASRVDAIAPRVAPPPAGLLAYRRAKPTNLPAWSWKWAFDTINRALQDRLENYKLPLPEGPLVQESAWRTALALVNNMNGPHAYNINDPDGTTSEVTVHTRPDLDHSPIPLDQIEVLLREHTGPYYERRPSGWLHEQPRDRRFSLVHLRNEVARLRAAGESELRSPWPIADREDFIGLRWDWELFTPEQIVRRAEAIYTGALHAYERIVRLWFPRLAPRLAHAVLLPVRLLGTIHVPEKSEDGQYRGYPAPGIHYYFEPLPVGARSTIDFRLHTDEHRRTWDWQSSDWHHQVFAELREKIASHRPSAREWLNPTISNSILRIFYVGDDAKLAAMHLVLSWLQSDLENIGWTRFAT